MPHVRFTAQFDWMPRHHVMISYKQGWTGPVTRRCAAKAIEAGKAEKVPTPKRAQADG